jgi:ribosomal protein L24
MAEGDLVRVTRGGFAGSVGKVERIVNETVALVTVPRECERRGSKYWTYSQYFLMQANLEVAN